MEEEGEGLGGSGPGRVWPVSAMPPLREDGVRSSQPLWEQCRLLLLVCSTNGWNCVLQLMQVQTCLLPIVSVAPGE